MTDTLDTVVTIDGPAASGKTMLGLALAGSLDYEFLDTGALYRGFTWLALRDGVDDDDEAGLAELASIHPPTLAREGRELHVCFDGVDVMGHLREPDVEASVSHVSRHPRVREALRGVQRRLVERGRIVMAGRDIGTVIAPDAGTRIYLTASEEVRRHRRGLQSEQMGDQRAAADVEANIRERDRIDSTRAASPLAVPDGACVIDTDGLTREQVLERALECIANRR